MACCSVQPRGRIFVKGYGFLFFARNMGRNIRKNLSNKYSQRIFDHAKESAADSI